jgi:high-affinity nickel permease
MFALLKSLALERSLRNRLISIGAALLAFHVLLFASIMVSTPEYPILAGLALLAYGLGLRHAVDLERSQSCENRLLGLLYHRPFCNQLGRFCDVL